MSKDNIYKPIDTNIPKEPVPIRDKLGRFVKGSPCPNPGGTSNVKKEVISQMKDLINDPSTMKRFVAHMKKADDKTFLEYYKQSYIIAYGKPGIRKQDRENTIPQDLGSLIQPIVIPQETFNQIMAEKNDDS